MYAHPKLLIYPSSPSPFGNHGIVFLCLWDYFCFVNKFISITFLDSTYKWDHTIPIFPCMTSLSVITSCSLFNFAALASPLLRTQRFREFQRLAEAHTSTKGCTSSLNLRTSSSNTVINPLDHTLWTPATAQHIHSPALGIFMRILEEKTMPLVTWNLSSEDVTSYCSSQIKLANLTGKNPFLVYK